MIKSVTNLKDEECTPEIAAFMIARGRKLNIDLTEIEAEYHPDKKIYMFLSLFWGVLADCDINSEFLRWIGVIRFTLWGTFRVFFKKNYSGSLYYKGCKIRNKYKLDDNDI